MTISPDQIRAALGLLEWSQANLVERAGVPYSAVKSAERPEEIGSVEPALLDRIRRALEDADVEFISRGVRRRAARADEKQRYDRIMAISRDSAASLAGRDDLLTDDDLYDENGLPA